ncbi:MAG: inner membrane-spanning protein YciB [Maricaulaceae bacterium]|jgi:intracellular septation protein
MTDSPSTSGQTAAQTAGQGVRLLVDVGPVIAFVIAYNVAHRANADTAVFWGTGVYMAAMIAAVSYSWIAFRRIPLILAVTSVIVLLFGGLTLAFQSAEFAYAKPTVINWLLAGLIVGSLIIGQNVWKLFFGSVFELPDRIWTVLALRWAVWFVFLGALNLALWPPFWEGKDVFWLNWTGQESEEFWAYFKLWGVMPLTFLFAMANVPITMKHGTFPQEETGKDEAQ